MWAEAYSYQWAGETLYLDDELEQVARAAQDAHTEVDEREGKIREFLELELPASWDTKDLYARRQWLSADESVREAGTHKRSRVCVPEIWCEVLGGDIKDIKREAKSLHNIMRNVEGWRLCEYKRRSELYGMLRTYERAI
jgi:hypothetical protein